MRKLSNSRFPNRLDDNRFKNSISNNLGGGGSAGYGVTIGPTVQAANAAAQAQISAAQQAAAAATAETQSAIQALMGEYSTALEYAGPEINTGNQAEAQMNYMLGLPAVSPGAAPVAPTAPTAPSTDPTAIYNAIINSNYVGVGPGSPGNISGIQNILNNSPNISGVLADMGINVQEQNGSWANTQNPTLAQLTALQASNPTAYAQLTNVVNGPEDVAYTNAQNNYTNAETIYNQQEAAYNQQEATYQDYLNKGTATSADISNIITNMPGYQFNLNQGISSIQNAASASGMLNSGDLLEQLNQFGQGQASTYYDNYMNQLGGLAGLGTQATNTAATGATNVGNTTAGLLNALGNTQANAYLAAGNAEASSYLNPAVNQQVVATGFGSQGGGGASGIGSILGGLGSLFGAL